MRIPRLLSLLILLCPLQLLAADVTLHRLPDAGLEPDVAVDSKGALHLIYFTGEAKAGDIIYRTSTDSAATFSPAIRVNSDPGAALIVGAVRGPRLAVDSNDKAHVIWSGSDKTQPNPRLVGLPLLYWKYDADQLTQQRHILSSSVGIDGGASIAADRNGNVDIIWHAPEKKDGDEQSRKLWLVRSIDDFTSRTLLDMPDIGVCACCALHAFYDDADIRHIIFRGADEMVHRDNYLLTQGGKPRLLSEWRVGKCVMSTSHAAGNVIAWESQDRIMISSTGGSNTTSLGKKNPKHPRLALSRDHVLVTWTENTAWHKGGSVVWQLLDRALKPIEGATGRADDLPAWGYPAAFPTPAGSFVILY